MIKSKTELFNAVLTRLGEKRINDSNVTDNSAVVLRGVYQQAVDEVLGKPDYVYVDGSWLKQLQLS